MKAISEAGYSAVPKTPKLKKLSMLTAACAVAALAAVAASLPVSTALSPLGAFAADGAKFASPSSQFLTLVEALQHRERLFQNPSGHFTHVSQPSPGRIEEMKKIGNAWMLPPSGPMISKYFWATDGVRWRCDLEHTAPANRPDGFVQQAFDGKRYSSLDPRNGELMNYPTDVFHPDFETEIPYFMMYQGKPSKPLSEYLVEHNAQVAGWEVHGGLNCLKVTLSLHVRDYSTDYVFWFSGEHGFATKEVQRVQRVDGSDTTKGASFTMNNFRKFGEGFWQPMQVRRELFTIKDGQPRDVESTNTLTADDFTLNTPDIEAQFQLPIPIGTKVFKQGKLPTVFGVDPA